ncbi:MAG: hypothetical protein P4L81_05195 [Candidatus Pacebacteria bacterium]|nr:hypothetical protein [Candidatus Paceibacterota bacterium]
MNAYITYGDNLDELVRQLREELFHEDAQGLSRSPKPRPRRNPLAREEAIEEDCSNSD